MKSSLRNTVVGGAAAVLLMGLASGAANASYLGYGNGDPGDWDFWTEQHGGPVHKAKGHVRHAHRQHAAPAKDKTHS
jgi:hypothetical protein